MNPEIVYDLAHSVGGEHADEILALYRSRTYRCIVRFVSCEPRADVIKRALAYVHHAIHGDDEPAFWNTCFDGEGKAVPVEQILSLEWLE